MNTNFWCEKEIGELINRIGQANKEEVGALFDAILTPREINDMAKRLKIIELLNKGETYTEIQQTLRVSPVIISRVSNKIGYGFRRSYARARNKESIKTASKKSSLIRYKGAVPLHRWFE